VIACVVAFPFWIAFARFSEFVPKGVKRESEFLRRIGYAPEQLEKVEFKVTLPQ